MTHIARVEKTVVPIKEKEKNNSIYRDAIMSLEKLENLLSCNSQLHSLLLSRYSSEINQTELMEYLNNFFAYQKRKGYRIREIDEVKNHFQN